MIKSGIECYRIISGAILVIFIVGLVACTDGFKDLNTPKDELNTANLTKNQLGSALAEAEYSGLMTWYQVSHNLYAGAWSQFFTIIHPNFPSSQFEEVGSWSDPTFRGFYTYTRYGAAASQLKFVEDYTEKNNLSVANAIAKVWRVELYHWITDYWGPIIYSQFGNGQTSVPYDSQESIYMNFLKTLDDAVNVFKEHTGETSFFGSNDLVYGGNVDQYLKWANSLRLRLAIRISYIKPDLAQQEAEKALNALGGVIIDNSDNALLTSTQNNQNKLSTITYINEFVMSATMESILVGYHDPRTSVYMQPCCGRVNPTDPSHPTDFLYIGARNGNPQRSKTMIEDYSYLATKWLPIPDGGSNEPDRLMEAAEVYFLRAEGALRGWNMGGTAEELYNKGIRASLETRTDASEQEIANYINSTDTPIAPRAKDGGPDQFNSPPVTDIPVRFQPGAGFETKLEQIITQKWLALYPMNDVEAWAERRRTGYPKGYAIIKSNNPRVSETEFVRRLTFVPSEFDNNATAVEAAKKLLNGPDENDTRVWWDAKPLADYPTPTDPQN